MAGMSSKNAITLALTIFLLATGPIFLLYAIGPSYEGPTTTVWIFRVVCFAYTPLLMAAIYLGRTTSARYFLLAVIPLGMFCVWAAAMTYIIFFVPLHAD
jgi:hypothetical protein